MLRDGYDALSIQDITDHADLGRGTFYIHFKDKEDLVWAIIKEGLDSADRDAQREVEKLGALPPRPEYFAYVNMLRHAEGNRDLYRVMLGGHGSSMLTTRVQSYLADNLAHDMRQVPIFTSTMDIPEIIKAQIITGAIVRLIIWWLDNPGTYSAETLAELLYEMLHH